MMINITIDVILWNLGEIKKRYMCSGVNLFSFCGLIREI
jgi:hypothetical protein